MNSGKIDFVLTWVEDNDPYWIEDFNKYNKSDRDSRPKRFRNWDILQYLFRAFEKFTAWVNKIYFVTYGHIPSWLDMTDNKLVIVKHEDIMPKEHLPTFNSCAIEVNLYKIKGLSEQFVYFNDDTLLLKSIDKTVFFKKNLPVNAAISNITNTGESAYIAVNNVGLINKNFNKKINKKLRKNSIIFRNFFKWFYPGYHFHIIKTLTLMPWSAFTGFKKYHHPQPFLKNTFIEVWQKESKKLTTVSSSKFRSYSDVSQYLFKYWQFATGKFYPDSYEKAYKKRKYIELRTQNVATRTAKLINKEKYEMLFLNDEISGASFSSEDIAIKEFDKSKDFIKQVLEKILPTRSSFERNE